MPREHRNDGCGRFSAGFIDEPPIQDTSEVIARRGVRGGRFMSLGGGRRAASVLTSHGRIEKFEAPDLRAAVDFDLGALHGADGTRFVIAWTSFDS